MNVHVPPIVFEQTLYILLYNSNAGLIHKRSRLNLFDRIATFRASDEKCYLSRGCDAKMGLGRSNYSGVIRV